MASEPGGPVAGQGASSGTGDCKVMCSVVGHVTFFFFFLAKGSGLVGKEGKGKIEADLNVEKLPLKSFYPVAN